MRPSWEKTNKQSDINNEKMTINKLLIYIERKKSTLYSGPADIIYRFFLFFALCRLFYWFFFLNSLHVFFTLRKLFLTLYALIRLLHSTWIFAPPIFFSHLILFSPSIKKFPLHIITHVKIHTRNSTWEKPPRSQIEKLENYVCECVWSAILTNCLFIFPINLSHHIFAIFLSPKWVIIHTI